MRTPSDAGRPLSQLSVEELRAIAACDGKFEYVSLGPWDELAVTLLIIAHYIREKSNQ